MEKNGLINLTNSEIHLFNSTGTIPDRVKTCWGIDTKEEFKDIIESGRFNRVEDKSSSPHLTLK